MKTYFLNLLNYDKHANELIVNAILANNYNEKAVGILSHMLVAQQIWYNRCNNLPAAGGALWPDWEASDLMPAIAENHLKWISFLDTLQDPDFQQQIAYHDSKGNRYTNRLLDIITHLINHGTHHRAQAGIYLKAEGALLPPTDYIFYVRSLPNEK